MKTKGKAWQLVVTALLIVVFVYTAFFGVAAKYGDVTTTYIKGAKDIRFGVDIKGGVNVTFVPSDGYDATDEQLDAARLVIENRLVALNVTDYELYVDNNSDSLILEFPWQSGETEFDPEAAIEEIGTTAYLTFREGSSADGALVLDGSMVESAAAQYGPVNGSSSEYYVALKFTDEGAKAFGDATTRLYQTGGTISIWLDDENVSTASVNAAITDGSAIITSSASSPFTQEDVVKMARQINSGSLPFALTVDSYSTISPSLGENSLSAMVLAGVIALSTYIPEARLITEDLSAANRKALAAPDPDPATVTDFVLPEPYIPRKYTDGIPHDEKGEKELVDYKVDDLIFRPRKRREKVKMDDELKKLEAMEKKERKSKL